MLKKAIIRFLGIDKYLEKIDKIEEWEVGIDEDIKNLKQKIEYLEKSQQSITETIGNINIELKNVIEELNRIKDGNEKISEVIERLNNIEHKLKDIEQSQIGKMAKCIGEDSNVEDVIIGIVSMRDGVCISDLLDNLKISKRKLYDALAKLEKSGKIKRERKGKKVIIKLK